MTQQIVVTVIGGPTATFDWQPGMTALRAMELANSIIEPDPDEQFTFALQYYGEQLGYLVSMINETYDSFISRGGEKATPFFYWNFMVNDLPATQSVDRTTLSAGDEVSFSFEMFSIDAHAGTLMQQKHERLTR